MESLLDVVENAAGAVRSLEVAERRAIDELSQMGREVMQCWGQRAPEEEAREKEAKGGAIRQEKRLH